MTRRASGSNIDRLIAESKQVTSDLMALRHELQRGTPDRVFGGWKNRADLLYGNLQRMTDELFALRYPKPEIDSEEISDFATPRPRALTNGQLRLTAGGR